MSRISKAIHGIHHLDFMSKQDKWINNIHPLSKLIVTFCYIAFVVSFDRYNLAGLLGMILYPLFIMITGEIPFRQSLRRLRTLLFFVCLLGIVNPFFDKTVFGDIGGFKITGGMVSMVTLMLKGIFTVIASYLLVITTSLEDICRALRMLRVPKILVTLIMLIYRYIIVLLKETERILQAYFMRAPNQKGIHFRVWGTLTGQLLLRSMDRAQLVYESMVLRGYDGNYSMKSRTGTDIKSIFYCAVWILVIVALRFIPVLEIAGNMFI